MSNALVIALGLSLGFPQISGAEEIAPQIDVRLQIDDRDGDQIEFVIKNENDECRTLAGRRFTKSLLERMSREDIDLHRLHRNRFRIYSKISLVCFGVAAIATGMEIASAVHLGKSLFDQWLLPTEMLGAGLLGGMHLGMHARVERENKAILNTQLMNRLLSRNLPRRRSEFIKFVGELEALLIQVSKKHCENQLR